MGSLVLCCRDRHHGGYVRPAHVDYGSSNFNYNSHHGGQHQGGHYHYDNVAPSTHIMSQPNYHANNYNANNNFNANANNYNA
jgi:hypothetical protein